MLSAAYELFGCNTSELFIMSVNTGNTNAQCIQFDQTYGIDFPTISGIEGGGNAINNAYGIGAYPTYILIAPNHDIVEQDMWPISNVQTFINYFQSNGLQQAECMEVNFSSDLTEVCEMDAIQFNDASTGPVISWNWVFEGGNPAVSSDQNPLVTYDNAGTYNVELTISNGYTSQSFLLEDYVTVLETPVTTLMPFNDVCVGWPAFELTGGTPAGGNYSGPGVSDGWFDPSVAGLGTHVITYTFESVNGCDNSAQQPILVDPCTGVIEIAQGTLIIYPNPTTGNIELKLNDPGKSVITVFNILGKNIYHAMVDIDLNESVKINLEGNEAGIYIIQVQSDNGLYFQKVKLIN